MITQTIKAVIAALLATPAAGCISQSWQRHDGPIFRDRLFLGLYEVASDAHVVPHGAGFAMFYTGDDQDHASIKLALGDSLTDWEQAGVLLGPSQQPDAIAYKETPFYFQMGPQDHRLYFIGYDDETTYEAQIYVATAPAITGPWVIRDDPVVRRGAMAGRAVYLMTSPSVVRHDGDLVMTWLGWDGFQNVTQVWTFAATSSDGIDWSAPRQTQTPIGMEGQITPRPGGGFVAVSTQMTDSGVEGIFAACADSPFGPWTPLPRPLLTLAGDRWEGDEITAPAITYVPGSDAARLIYTGATHADGWRIMMAQPAD